MQLTLQTFFQSDYFNKQEAEVTILSEKFSPETTGDGAAGLWLPFYIDPETPDENVLLVFHFFNLINFFDFLLILHFGQGILKGEASLYH